MPGRAPSDSKIVKKWEPLTADDKIRITVERFAPMIQGHKPEAVRLLAKRYKRDAAQITKAIQAAFREGLVELAVADPSEPGKHVEDLEDALYQKYKGTLRRAIVVRSQPRAPDENHPALDDMVHRELGRAMAGHISSGAVFRDGDWIGLGSGRGVYYTVEALMQFPRLRILNVTLLSLTGAVHARDHAQLLNTRLDADIHLGLFGMSFESGAVLRAQSIDYPIAITEGSSGGIIGAEELGKARVLVGVGVLAPGHRFYDYCHQRGTQSPADANLAPIQVPLGKLVSICDEIQKTFPFYFPVGDICNALFCVKAPGGVNIPPLLMKKLLEAIAEVNRHLRNVRTAELRNVSEIVLVAGTTKKAAAIRQLLDEGYPIRQLCTDSAAAEEILNPKPLAGG